MKSSDQSALTTLGKMQAIHDAMNIKPPSDVQARKYFIEAKRIFFKSLNRHWDICNEMLTEDDT